MEEQLIAYGLFFAAVWGFSASIAFSKLTAPLVGWLRSRKSGTLSFFGELFGCPMCLSWHASYLSVLFGIAPGSNTVVHAFTLAFAAAGISLLLALIVEKLGREPDANVE